MNDGRIFSVDILYPDKKRDMEHFRVRETKRNNDFPVGLYSIDFRIYITETEGRRFKRTFKHDISILDVVLQDKETDKYHDYYVQEVGGIPVASLKFLLKDLINTYTSDSAYGRLSSGKFKKDISRYNTLAELSQQDKVPISDIKEFQLSAEDMKSLEKYKSRNLCISEIHRILTERDDKMIDFKITNICRKVLLKPELSKLFQSNPRLKLLFIDMLGFKSNFYNEKLSSVDTDYFVYTEDDNFIRQNYYALFSRLCSKKDGLFRHSILFQKSRIMENIRQELRKIPSSVNVSRATGVKRVRTTDGSSSAPVVAKVSKTSVPQPVPQPVSQPVVPIVIDDNDNKPRKPPSQPISSRLRNRVSKPP
jgi:hypothetical protein